MQLANVSGGETILSGGDPSTAVYVIEDGEVAVTVDEVARPRAGELFGEAGVLEKRARSASPTAVLPTRLLITDAETLSHAFGIEDERALARTIGPRTRIGRHRLDAFKMGGAARQGSQVVFTKSHCPRCRVAPQGRPPPKSPVGFLPNDPA